MADAIVTEGLRKSYGDQVALVGLDLVVPEGSVMGLLGPNGAGKSTVVRILSTLVAPDGGKATVAGFDLAGQSDKVRRAISIAGQYASVDENLTGYENLHMICRLLHFSRRRSSERAAELLERFYLVDAASRRVKDYSGGMRRRLDLAASLVTTPRVLFLDEPTTGLDTRSRMALWEVLTGLVAGGMTLLLTTQYLEEADRIADRIVLIDHGRVIAQGSTEDLKRQVSGERLAVTLAPESSLPDARRLLAAVGTGEVAVDEQRRQLDVPVANGLDALLDGVRRLREGGLTVLDAGLRRPTLDDVFLALTERPVGAAGAPGGSGPPTPRDRDALAAADPDRRDQEYVR